MKKIISASLLALLFLAPLQSASAAVAFVKSSTLVKCTNTTTCAFSLASVTAGDFVAIGLVMAAQGQHGASAAPAGWTTATSTATQSNLQFRPKAAIFYKISTGGTESGTVTIGPAGSFAEGCIVELSGVTSNSPVDVLQQSNTGSTLGTSGNTGTSAATSQADEVVLAIGGPEGNNSVTGMSSPASSGYTSICTDATDATAMAFDYSYKILNTTGTQIASYTWTGSDPSEFILATFKATVATVTTVVRPRIMLITGIFKLLAGKLSF